MDNSGDTPVLSIYSYGPDRHDDNGTDDDLTLTVSSVPPGRKTTWYLLTIAQTVLNENSTLNLQDDWDDVMVDLNLGSAFARDGWGRGFQINENSRTVFSSGPDGTPGTVADNIPSEVGPDGSGSGNVTPGQSDGGGGGGGG